MITIKSEKKSYGINFPTSKEEITSELLEAVTKQVKLPKHYCIVALCFQTKVFDFVTMTKSRNNPNVAVTPVLAKISADDAELINASVGDKLIIDRSSLERGVHLNLPVAINSNSARNYFEADPELCRNIMTKSDKSNVDKKLVDIKNSNIIILEFKIVPVNDISAANPMKHEVFDPFISYSKVSN